VDVDAATGRVNALGDDGIKVGLLYKSSRVRPVARTAVLRTVPFVTGGDSVPRNRPSLAQAFEQSDGARLVVNVNHLKSKGGACAEPDAGDGQAECSMVRLRAANLLRDWLATDPTGANDPDVLILGDLNAYAREDPVRALEAAGYVNLARAIGGAGSYSYGFDGQWGSLDHALASASLRSQVTGAADFHINADEPTALDFNTEFKSPALRDALYAPDPFRSSDHDPVLVGLRLQPPPSRGAPAGGTFARARQVPPRFSAHR
jgi:predicted extracellular nuclease